MPLSGGTRSLYNLLRLSSSPSSPRVLRSSNLDFILRIVDSPNFTELVLTVLKDWPVRESRTTHHLTYDLHFSFRYWWSLFWHLNEKYCKTISFSDVCIIVFFCEMQFFVLFHLSWLSSNFVDSSKLYVRTKWRWCNIRSAIEPR